MERSEKNLKKEEKEKRKINGALFLFHNGCFVHRKERRKLSESLLHDCIDILKAGTEGSKRA
jgi:hypothetical protein